MKHNRNSLTDAASGIFIRYNKAQCAYICSIAIKPINEGLGKFKIRVTYEK